MIEFEGNGIYGEGLSSDNAILFDDPDIPKIIKWLERAANTLSPPDAELLKVLDDMKSAQAQRRES